MRTSKPSERIQRRRKGGERRRAHKTYIYHIDEDIKRVHTKREEERKKRE